LQLPSPDSIFITSPSAPSLFKSRQGFLKRMLASGSSMSVQYTVNLVLGEGNTYSNSQQAYDSSVSLLTNSISSGNFDKSLQQNAVSSNTPSMVSVSTDSSTLSVSSYNTVILQTPKPSYVPTSSPSGQPTSSPSCPEGHSHDGSVSSGCSACQPGHYRNEYTNGHCLACSAGYAQPIAGSSACVKCPYPSTSIFPGSVSCDGIDFGVNVTFISLALLAIAISLLFVIQMGAHNASPTAKNPLISFEVNSGGCIRSCSTEKGVFIILVL